MKKALLLGLSTLALISTASSSHARMTNNWYVGAGASWVASNFQNKYTSSLDPTSSDPTYKIGMEDKSAFGGTLLLGHNFDFSNWDMFTEFSYGFDSSSSKAKSSFEDSDYNLSINRYHTYSLGLGVSKDINETMGAYFKLSALFSKFEIDIKVPDLGGGGESGAASHKRWVWGWAPTLGLSKNLGSDFTLKTDYTYQIYNTYKKGLTLSANTDSPTHTKTSPKYHVVAITLTKTL